MSCACVYKSRESTNAGNLKENQEALFVKAPPSTAACVRERVVKIKGQERGKVVGGGKRKSEKERESEGGP